MVYLNSYNRFPLFTHNYLCILILEHPLRHTSSINTQIEGSPGLSPHICEPECGLHVSRPRQKEKQAGAPNWGSHLQLLPLLLAESFYLKQTESWEQHFKWLAISKFSYENTDLVFKHIKQQTPKVHPRPLASLWP